MADWRISQTPCHQADQRSVTRWFCEESRDGPGGIGTSGGEGARDGAQTLARCLELWERTGDHPLLARLRPTATPGEDPINGAVASVKATPAPDQPCRRQLCWSLGTRTSLSRPPLNDRRKAEPPGWIRRNEVETLVFATAHMLDEELNHRADGSILQRDDRNRSRLDPKSTGNALSDHCFALYRSTESGSTVRKRPVASRWLRSRMELALTRSCGTSKPCALNASVISALTTWLAGRSTVHSPILQA